MRDPTPSERKLLAVILIEELLNTRVTASNGFPTLPWEEIQRVAATYGWSIVPRETGGSFMRTIRAEVLSDFGIPTPLVENEDNHGVTKIDQSNPGLRLCLPSSS